jgi:hypothetical protein
MSRPKSLKIKEISLSKLKIMNKQQVNILKDLN